ncbi:MAG TPA: curli-like amyloid fiber formation chaperone CsgH [Hyphomicrobiales bacterium]|nr:curli-like amyloid fiber formation chaperone CsgH [Hyphomicrobiales bacterium]
MIGLAAMLAGLAGAAAAAAPARQVLAERQEGGLRCVIAATRESGGLVVRALVESAETAQGKYQFSARKHGTAGNATVGQSGAFKAPPGAETQVGQVGLGHAAGTMLDLTLSVRLAGGAACTTSYRGPAGPPERL